MIPRSTAGMYSLGIAPPLMSLTNWKPPPGRHRLDHDRDVGELAPAPVWRAKRVRCSTFREIVSL